MGSPSSNCSSCHSCPADKLTGFEVSDQFERFDQRNDIYCRALWDARVKSEKSDRFFDGYYMPHAKARKADGFSQKDYAFRNAAWHVSNVLRDVKQAGAFRWEKPDENRKEGFWDYFTSHDQGWPSPQAFESPEDATQEFRRIARFCGVEVMGICENDRRWMYSRLYDKDNPKGKPPEVPEDISSVIVIAEPMDYDLVSTVPSALSGAATGLGYTFDSVTLLTLAQYIRNLGYRAYGSMNDSSLCVPLAVQAGLGEAGRSGLLITPEYGPRLRIGKIYTDMPLVHSAPRQFGIEKFCEQCDRCAKACPPKALPLEEKTEDIFNVSNIKGVKKWTSDAEKCFKFWAAQNSDCVICIRACPYNRDYRKWANRMWFKLASGPLRRLALWLDDTFVSRGRLKTADWWAKTGK